MNLDELTVKELRTIQKWYLFFEGVTGYRPDDNELWQKVRKLADEMEKEKYDN